jgi:hypothetical protein
MARPFAGSCHAGSALAGPDVRRHYLRRCARTSADSPIRNMLRTYGAGRDLSSSESDDVWRVHAVRTRPCRPLALRPEETPADRRGDGGDRAHWVPAGEQTTAFRPTGSEVLAIPVKGTVVFDLRPHQTEEDPHRIHEHMNQPRAGWVQDLVAGRHRLDLVPQVLKSAGDVDHAEVEDNHDHQGPDEARPDLDEPVPTRRIVERKQARRL